MFARQILAASKRHNPGGRGLWVGGYGQNPRPRPQVVWIDATEFADRLRSGEFSLPESFTDDWLVVFDDLGAVRDKSDFVADAIFRFCNSRHGKWTVFTTNLNITEIGSAIDDRVASRLIRDSNRFYRIEARDYAIVKRLRAE
jgi:DNA replication protein DnaC